MDLKSKEAKVAMLKARINKIAQNPANLRSPGVINRLRADLKKLESE